MAKGANLSCVNLDDIHRSLDEPNFISNITLFIRIMPGQKNHTDKFQQKTRDKNYIVRWDHLGNTSNKNNPNSVADKPFQDKRNSHEISFPSKSHHRERILGWKISYEGESFFERG